MATEMKVNIKAKEVNKWVVPFYVSCYKLGLFFLLPLLERVPILKVTAGEGRKKNVTTSRLGQVVKYQSTNQSNGKL